MEWTYNTAPDIPKLPESTAREASKSYSAGDLLLRRISCNKDFPSFSKSIIEINRQIFSNSKHSSASNLSNTILKDYALTSKLLKLVNSAFYGMTAAKVTTITRAVVLLGYENVRLAATSLMLFEHLKSKSSGTELQEASVRAFWSGLIAKDVAKIMGLPGTEEAFICAMLHNLGRHIVLFYLPDKCDEITNLILNKGVSGATASKSILGISFEDLGITMAKEWNFPSRIVNSMKRLSSEELQRRKRKDKTLQALSNFSNELCHIINHTEGNKREASLSALMKRYKKYVRLSKKQLSRVIDASLEKVRKHADVLNISIGGSRFLDRLTAGAQKQQRDHRGQNLDSGLELDATKFLADSQTNPDDSDSRLNDHKKDDPIEVILSGVQDIAAAMVGEYEINDIALIALESMYRGVGFNRVVFFSMKKNGKQLEARFGFGPDIEHIANKVSFEIVETHNIFNMALAKGKDLIIADTDERHIRQLIPGWFRHNFNAPAFVFLPITYNKTCLGAFYADLKNAGPPLPEGQYNFLNMFRNLLVLSIKYCK